MDPQITIHQTLAVATSFLAAEPPPPISVSIDDVGVPIPVPILIEDATGFGAAVAAGSGSVLIGVDGRRDGPRHPGSVACYERVGSIWRCSRLLRGPEPSPGDEFGAALAMDRSRVLVGSPGMSNQRGGAWCFDRSESRRWSPARPLLPRSARPGDRFGETVALSDDWALVAGPRADVGDVVDAGRVDVFALSPKTPISVAVLGADHPRRSGRFGSSIAIGPVWAIGEIGASPVGPDGLEIDRAGVVHRFERTPPFAGSSPIGREDPGRLDRTGTAIDFFRRRLVIGSPRVDTGIGRSGVVTIVDPGNALDRELQRPRQPDGGLGSALVAMPPILAFTVPGKRNGAGRVDGCVRIGVLDRDGFDPRIDVVGFEGDGAELTLAADPIDRRLVVGMPGQDEDGPSTGRAWTIDLEIVEPTPAINPRPADRSDR